MPTLCWMCEWECARVISRAFLVFFLLFEEWRHRSGKTIFPTRRQFRLLQLVLLRRRPCLLIIIIIISAASGVHCVQHQCPKHQHNADDVPTRVWMRKEQNGEHQREQLQQTNEKIKMGTLFQKIEIFLTFRSVITMEQVKGPKSVIILETKHCRKNNLENVFFLFFYSSQPILTCPMAPANANSPISFNTYGWAAMKRKKAANSPVPTSNSARKNDANPFIANSIVHLSIVCRRLIRSGNI